MKKAVYILIALVIIISSFGCSTKLKIVNNTSYDLDLISWIDETWRIYWFGNDLVYDYVLGYYIEGLHPGSSDEQDVGPGYCPVYFWFASGGPEYCTCELVGVEKWKSTTFVLTDYTLIMSNKTSAEELKKMTEFLDKTSAEDELRRFKKYRDM